VHGVGDWAGAKWVRHRVVDSGEDTQIEGGVYLLGADGCEMG
jgi:hypothetical protein